MGVPEHRTALVLFTVTVWVLQILSVSDANVQSEVRCSLQTMEVEITEITKEALAYLQFKNYPDKSCTPNISHNKVTFHLPLIDNEVSSCGVTRTIHKQTVLCTKAAVIAILQFQKKGRF
ncbi:uncharacterized protein LOC106639254 [Copidosoma floridanum]|uniref:uncharacterized protein LOC106639254 n=1 Tax=Copidosoma floridanum TaxID=29053 RepID=UPI0006C98374|nr:uncharacterized protein LOC106639254 [Copidosoma floridanum]